MKTAAQKQRDKHLMSDAAFIAVILLSSAALATTTTTKPRMEQVKDEWNNVICTVLKIVQYTSVGLAVLVVMAAGLKMLSADDPAAREGSRQMIVQAFVGLIIVFSAVHLVNYLVTGTRIDEFDMNACNVSFGGAVTTTSITTSSVSSSSSSSTSSTSTTTTTSVTGTTVLLTQEQIQKCILAQEWRHEFPGADDACYEFLPESHINPDDCCSQLSLCCPEP